MARWRLKRKTVKNQLWRMQCVQWTSTDVVAHLEESWEEWSKVEEWREQTLRAKFLSQIFSQEGSSRDPVGGITLSVTSSLSVFLHVVMREALSFMVLVVLHVVVVKLGRGGCGPMAQSSQLESRPNCCGRAAGMRERGTGEAKLFHDVTITRRRWRHRKSVAYMGHVGLVLMIE